MRLRVIKAYFFKEMIELVRSKLIMMPYLMPFIIVILFGYGIKMQVSGVRLVILDYDNTPTSREIITKFEHSTYFHTQISHESEQEALRRIKQATVDAILIIPSSLEKNIIKGAKSELGVFIDSAFPSRATTIENYIQGTLTTLMSEHVRPEHLITINQRNMFNQALRDEEMIVPALLGLVLFVAPAMLTALLIAKEKERGTIFNFYTSNVSKAEFLIAKLSAVFTLHSLNILFLFALVIILFDLPFRGSFILYWLTSELYILISLGFGLIISILVSTQIVAVILTLMMTILPASLYSGMLVPISSMSGEAYIIAHLYPVMYYNHIIYDVFLIGSGIEHGKTLPYLGVLILYAGLLFVLGMGLLKKELRS